jgi:hypothetical protein
MFISCYYSKSTVFIGYVYSIELKECKIEGTIPKSIVNLVYLDTFIAINNNFTGTIPNEITQLSNLRNLNLGYNNFNGSIPEEIKNNLQLEYLVLEHNELIGKIPQEIFFLLNLKTILLNNNQMTGTISENITVLFSKTYNEYEDINNTSIFTVVSKIGHLQNLNLAFNLFTGSLPFTYVYAPNLQNIILNNNLFTGKMPFFNCTRLLILNLAYNQFSGAISNIEAQSLKSFILNNNQLVFYRGFVAVFSAHPSNLFSEGLLPRKRFALCASNGGGILYKFRVNSVAC